MTPFADDLEHDLLRHGATTLFHDHVRFEAAVQHVTGLGYVVERIDARSAASFTADLTRALHFQDLFGYSPWTGNLDALNDAMASQDLDRGRGLFLCFDRMDALFAMAPQLAHGTLDILECCSRDHLVDGHRLFALVQTDDPDLHVDPVGARGVTWNPAEWLAASRRRGTPRPLA